MAAIHMILVADLDDPNIGVSCGVDLRAVGELMSVASAQTGMELRTTEITGRNFGAEQIASAVRDLSPDREDTVVFYYSGHGARGESKVDAWPVLSLGSPGPPFDSFDLAWIYRILHGKQPRMLLMFVDCCQQLLPDEMLSETSPTDLRSLADLHSVTNFRLLFQAFEGEVLLMSCKPGQLSGCNQSVGGFFTATFLEALRSAVNATRTPSWETIARLGACPPRAEQEPIWKVVGASQISEIQIPGMEPFPGNWEIGQAEAAGESILEISARAAQTEAALCRSCGGSMGPNDRFCAECGAPRSLAGNTVAPAPAPLPAGNQPASYPPSSRMDSILQQSEERIARAKKENEDRLARLLGRFKDQ